MNKSVNVSLKYLKKSQTTGKVQEDSPNDKDIETLIVIFPLSKSLLL